MILRQLKIMVCGMVVLCSTTVWCAQHESGNPYESSVNALTRACAIGGACSVCGLGGDCANVERCCRHMMPDTMSATRKCCFRAKNYCVLGGACCVLWTCMGPQAMADECAEKGAEFVGDVNKQLQRAFRCGACTHHENDDE
jgi:hypothetical protein